MHYLIRCWQQIIYGASVIPYYLNRDSGKEIKIKSNLQQLHIMSK